MAQWGLGPLCPRTFPEEGTAALVQQAGGQQCEVGHCIGLHGIEGRVHHDGAQSLTVQRPAQELADALHGAMEILGAGDRGWGVRRREWPPGEEGAAGPELGCLSTRPDYLGASASLPQFPHLQDEGWAMVCEGFCSFGLWRVLWVWGKGWAGSERTEVSPVPYAESPSFRLETGVSWSVPQTCCSPRSPSRNSPIICLVTGPPLPPCLPHACPRPSLP